MQITTFDSPGTRFTGGVESDSTTTCPIN